MQKQLQGAISAIVKNRAEFYKLVVELERQTGKVIDAGDLETEIDCEYAGQEEASPDDARAILSFINND